MKSKNKVLVLLLTAIIASVIFTKQLSAQQPYVSFQVFYDQLSPYGQWVTMSDYGYVWIPDAGQDFVPYSSEGHWILTNYGWTWLSNYEWGWAPFHYGRWDYNDYYGWYWIPDNEWGPAWVSWRRAEGYYGWEPMRPGISISLSFGQQYDNHYDHWIFVRDGDLDRPDVNHFYVSRHDHDRIVRNSEVINNTYVDNRRNTTYITGPAREDIQKSTGRRFNPVSVQENDKPGQDLNNGQFRTYRPFVAKNNNYDSRPSSPKIISVKDIKQPSQRDAPNHPADNRRESQPRVMVPQNNNNINNTRSGGQQHTSPPVQDSRREVPPNTANPQDRNNNSKPTQPQNMNPTQNNNKEHPKNNDKPTKNNNKRERTQRSGDGKETKENH
jgi:hypothetical protein